MADIWEAFKFLNESMDLKLDERALRASEAKFKQQWLEQRGFAQFGNVQDWEFFAHLEPKSLYGRGRR